MINLLLMLIAVAAGAVLPFQASLNAKMGHVVQSPFISSFISFVVGALSLLVYMVCARIPLGTMLNARSAPALLWLAGLLGAFYVTTVIFMVPRLGAALTFGLVIAGQMAVSIVFDHFGLLGVPVHPLSWQRAVGVVLLVGGVVMIKQ